jgi:ArsR family transcriptional regulator
LKKNVVAKPLSLGALDLVAVRFRMLAEPMRLRLLNELRDGEKTVTALVEATGAGQANVSKHLSLLADAGMGGRRKEGLSVYYFIVDESLFELCDLVCGRLQKELADKARHFRG